MKIQAIGGCCKKSTQNYENALEAVKKLGCPYEVEHIKDMNEIINLGVMSTPALIVNGKLIAAGRLLTVDQIIEAIKKI